jgi:hypothetical protein
VLGERGDRGGLPGGAAPAGEELGIGDDRIIDPAGHGPRIWFQVVPEGKTVKNRLHLDIGVSGGRSVPIEVRRQRVDAEAARLAAAGATIVRSLQEEGLDPLRGGHARSRGQRVRHQLNIAALVVSGMSRD